MRVEFTDVSVDEAAVERAAAVLRSGRYVKGPLVEEFEAEFADFCGVEHAVGVGSGTAALSLSMQAVGVEPSADVFVPAHTFFATASPAMALGARPVFVDVDPERYTMDPDDLASKVAASANPAAVVPVHLYGQPAEMDAIREVAADRDLAVVEDVCQAHGAAYRGRRTGALGDVGCFSFYPSKNLTVGGDGGMLVTDDEELARTARELRNHGRDATGAHVRLGLNDRLDETNAAVGLEQLKRLDERNEARQAAAAAYDEQLSALDPVKTPTVAPEVEHVYHLYVVRVPDRDALRESLEAAGVETGVHYPTPMHRHPAVERALSEAGREPPSLPEAERLCERVLSLPMHPNITEAEIEHVCDAVEAHYDGATAAGAHEVA